MPLDAGEMPNLPTGAAAERRLEVTSADGTSLAVKSEYDPRNVFVGNQNIRPMVSA